MNKQVIAPASTGLVTLPVPQKESNKHMPRGSSRSGEPYFSWPRFFVVVIAVLASLASFFAVRYIDQVVQGIPPKVETEVTKQIPEAIKKVVPDAVKEQLTVQIAERMKEDIKIQTDKTQAELFKRQDAHQQAIDDRINAIWKLVSSNQKTLGNALKNSVIGSPVVLKTTVPVGRELLEYAKGKAVAARSPKNAPIISQEQFNTITPYLFREFIDSELNDEMRSMRLEVASYKTVVNGIEFGYPKLNQYSGREVYVGDEDYADTIFFGAHIIFRGSCPLELKKVRFVNCTFDVADESNGDTFLKTLLRSDKPTLTLILPPRPGYVKGACQK